MIHPPLFLHFLIVALFLGAQQVLTAEVLSPTKNFSQAEKSEKYPAGNATIRKPITSKIFTHPSANMQHAKKLDFFVGFAFFRKLWVTPPSATTASDGLGPLYNARSCQLCHVRDGRGHPPDDGDSAVSMFLRLSIPPQTFADKKKLSSHKVNTIPDPVYGGQLQNAAIPGQKAEGKIHVEYQNINITYPDGETIILRKPHYSVNNLAYGDMHPDVMLSPRIAPSMIGLGLLEAIPKKDVLSLADENDADTNGISGKPNQAWSHKYNKVMIGRFGYKAGQATIDDQNQDAFLNDIGLSVPFHPNGWGDCSVKQRVCRDTPDGGSPQYDNLEAPKKVTDTLEFYARNLAVPMRRKVNNTDVLSGKKLFYESGCIACHHPKYKTANLPDQPEQSEQLIWPYTDLLLHDMGEGLADNRPEGDATGTEWRTAPLWGLGLAKTVSKRTMYLHDGRARTIEEAILWHGGEAQMAKAKFVALKKNQRQQLIQFLESL